MRNHVRVGSQNRIKESVTFSWQFAYVNKRRRVIKAKSNMRERIKKRKKLKVIL